MQAIFLNPCTFIKCSTIFTDPPTSSLKTKSTTPRSILLSTTTIGIPKVSMKSLISLASLLIVERIMPSTRFEIASLISFFSIASLKLVLNRIISLSLFLKYFSILNTTLEKK